MKKISLLSMLLIVVLATNLQSQVRIGSDADPNPSAVLDLNASDVVNNGTKGLNLPRVELSSTGSASPLTSHVAGMLVYNTRTTGDVTPGAYYNTGAVWVRIGDTNTTYSADGNTLELGGTTFSVKNLGITEGKLAANAVTSAKIKDGTIVAADLAAGAVTADKLNQMSATTGQVLKWSGSAWAPAVDANTTYTVNDAALTATINGAAKTFTANSSTAVALGTIYAPTTAGTSGQVLKSNGSGAPVWGTDNDTQYIGSPSITLSSGSFQRAALTGDVTAPANSNATTLATVSRSNTAAAQSPASGGTFTAVSGVTTDAKGRVTGVETKTVTLPADNNTTYSGSTSIALSSGSFQRAALTGDVTATANNNATTVTAIRGKTVAATAPTSGQVLMYNGSNWVPTSFSLGNIDHPTVNATGCDGSIIHFFGVFDYSTGTSGDVAKGVTNASNTADHGTLPTLDSAPADANFNHNPSYYLCIYKSNSTSSTWADAVNGCANATYDGKTDWYLPNVRELRAIYEATNNGFNNIITMVSYTDPMVSNAYWSSTEYSAPNGLYFNFPNGVQGNVVKTNGNYVRCVRRI